MVTTFYPPYNFGGDGIFVYQLSNELAARGHQIDVVHCRDAYDVVRSRGQLVNGAYPNHANVRVHTLQSRIGMFSPLATHQTGRPVFKAPRLRALLTHGGYDVIHYHNMSLIGLDALTYGQAVKLYTMHEHWLVCPLHVLWKFNREPCRRKQCIACTLLAGRPPQLWRSRPFVERALKHVDAFIAVSHFSQDKHREMGFNPPVPIEHIPCFVPHTPPGAVSSPHPRPYFLFVGRLEKMKGVQVLINAFMRFRAADLLVVGEGSYGSQLRELAAALPHVHFLGHQGSDTLPSLLRHALALLIPSIGYETFGIVALEAFAQRTPIIVHNLGPLPEIVAQSQGGVTYDDEASLVAVLERFAADPALHRDLGARGHDAWVEYWTPEPHLRQYFALIERIAARKRAAAVPTEAMI